MEMVNIIYDHFQPIFRNIFSWNFSGNFGSFKKGKAKRENGLN